LNATNIILGHPDPLSKDIIDEVNNAINEIGCEYNYENYIVTLSKKEMEIKILVILLSTQMFSHLAARKKCQQNWLRKNLIM